MTVEKRKSSSYKERGGVKRSWRIRAKREHHFEICTTQSKECIEKEILHEEYAGGGQQKGVGKGKKGQSSSKIVIQSR